MFFAGTTIVIILCILHIETSFAFTKITSAIPSFKTIFESTFRSTDLSSRTGLSFETCKVDPDCLGDRVCVGLVENTYFQLCKRTKDIECKCVPLTLVECPREYPNPSPVAEQCFNECPTAEHCGYGFYCQTINFQTSTSACAIACKKDDECFDEERCGYNPDHPRFGYCISAKVADNIGVPDFSIGDSIQPVVEPSLSSDVSKDTLQSEVEKESNGSVQPTVLPTLPSTSAACIDSASLTHLSPEDLVFPQHVLSNVICDMYGSCATRGHMVKFKGVAMMMKTYCEMVGCEKRVILVNSPKYSTGLTVPSKSEGLEYTAFAARYESVGEEKILSTIVHMGF